MKAVQATGNTALRRLNAKTMEVAKKGEWIVTAPSGNEYKFSDEDFKGLFKIKGEAEAPKTSPAKTPPAATEVAEPKPPVPGYKTEGG